jgi:hypothetical protein
MVVTFASGAVSGVHNFPDNRGIWSGLVVVKLLRYRMTINDHAVALDSHRGDDRGDHCGKGTRTGFRPSPLPPSTRSIAQPAGRWPLDGGLPEHARHGLTPAHDGVLAVLTGRR